MRSIVGDVSEVSCASAAGDGRSLDPERDVRLFEDVLLREHLPEVRPTGTGFELCFGAEECRIAAETTI